MDKQPTADLDMRDNLLNAGFTPNELDHKAKACICAEPHIEPVWSLRRYICTICGNTFYFPGNHLVKLHEESAAGSRTFGFNPNISNKYYIFDNQTILKDGKRYSMKELIEELLPDNFLVTHAAATPIGTKAATAGRTRPSFDEVFLKVAEVIAERGTCPRLQVGAVITANNKIVSTGYNGSPSGSPHCSEVGCMIEAETGRCKRAVHAEMNALIQLPNPNSFDYFRLYVTEFPCIECATVLANSHIKEVHHYGLQHYDPNRTQQSADILKSAGIRIIDHLR